MKNNKLDDLIAMLCAERGKEPPSLDNNEKKRRYFRSLVNTRRFYPASEELLRVQDEYLQEELLRKGITRLVDLKPIEQGIYLWKGDITRLQCDGIVNAANSIMLGCFRPNHCCVDNAVHTFAGIQLRLECLRIIREQGRANEIGQTKMTDGYNLPCKYILHTVGPYVQGALTQEHEQQLASCYRSSLALAEENGLQSLAFCCISTGEGRFPREKAAQIAIQTVMDYKKQTQSKIKIVFCVKRYDYAIYQKLLGIPDEQAFGIAKPIHNKAQLS